ncbi:MAG: hypothetical protein KJ964_09975 [Verrucomicrobia bacterium]|nr:hypothetical protein [Verrucomicrobiota bacterium]MBU1858032.1 hypothetical protein [Verrucomicrobiota bacterium]
MNDARVLLERQAAWQKTRAHLSWSEKIRQAEILRDAFLNLRRTRPGQLKTGNGDVAQPNLAED